MTDLAWMKVFIGTETALTGHLTAEEFGAYERIRRHYWQHASLPNDEARLMRVAGIDPDRWAEIADAIRPLLAEVLPRLDQERTVAASKRAKKVDAGHKGASARWGNGRTIGHANGTSIANAMAEPMRNQWPSASASDEERYEERLVLTRTHTPAREGHDVPFSKPETDDEARAWLGKQGVHASRMDEALGWLMGERLYADKLDGMKRPVSSPAYSSYAEATGRA